MITSIELLLKKICISSILLNVLLHANVLSSSLTSRTQLGNCTKLQFECDDGQCIHKLFVCDGILDCLDSSDETYKFCHNIRCNENSFRCDYGACIKKEYHCDGLNQCKDGSDELPKKCKRISEANRRSKRQAGKMCAKPLPSADKTITYKCGNKEETENCEENGFVHEFTTATIECNSNYHFINKTETYMRSICASNLWVPPINECTKSCEQTIPLNADLRCYRDGVNISCNETLLAGTSIRINPTCGILQGYNEYAEKYPQITCQKDGTWDKPLLLCVPEEDICKQYEAQTCVKIQDCPMAKAIIADRKAVLCGFNNERTGKMCCPLQTPSSNDSLTTINASLMNLSLTINQQNLPRIGSKNSTAIALSYCEKYSTNNKPKCINDEVPAGERKRAMLREHPHTALIGNDKSNPCCVGTLISERFVLSAATCCEYILWGEATWALLGIIDRTTVNNLPPNQLYSITERYDYPNFKLRTYKNNIALFKLHTSVTMSSYVKPACLFVPNFGLHINIKNFTTIGWGSSAIGAESISNILVKGTVSIVEDASCSTTKNWKHDAKSEICIGNSTDGEAVCVGTVGSPLLHRLDNQSCTWTVFGIWSFVTNRFNTCSDETKVKPFVYTRVSHYLDWIQSIVWP